MCYTKCKRPGSKVFILYDILEKANLYGQKTDKRFPGTGGGSTERQQEGI